MSLENPLYKGEQIKDLIPQRFPIMMVDTMYDANETECISGLTIAQDNFFCVDGYFLEPGLIEHIAQSASAHAGVKAKMKNEETSVGYIGEVKKFKLGSKPKVGSSLVTTIRIVSEVQNVSLIKAETKVGDEVVASCQMKIFIRE